MGQRIACRQCPRNCGTVRPSGFCGADDYMEVAAVCIHRGEEPPLIGSEGRGIVNVFFAHCNLQCIYCQNHQISGRRAVARRLTADQLADEICALLPQSACIVGFVTAAHYAEHLPAIINAIHCRGQKPTIVYNSSGYESLESLCMLDGLVDVYLPDLKYMDSSLAARYSHAPDYPTVAINALREMRRQVGSGLSTENGVAQRGIIVRHLVLPGAIENSIACLDAIADIFNPFSLHLALMAQYYPPKTDLPTELQRTLTPDEYNRVVQHAESLCLTSGWIQELSAEAVYRPDFANASPFEP